MLYLLSVGRNGLFFPILIATKSYFWEKLSNKHNLERNKRGHAQGSSQFIGQVCCMFRLPVEESSQNDIYSSIQPYRSLTAVYYTDYLISQLL